MLSNISCSVCFKDDKIKAGQQVDLVLDFDACKSVVTQGKGRYLLNPAGHGLHDQGHRRGRHLDGQRGQGRFHAHAVSVPGKRAAATAAKIASLSRPNEGRR
jgi:hypothetical protein